MKINLYATLASTMGWSRHTATFSPPHKRHRPVNEVSHLATSEERISLSCRSFSGLITHRSDGRTQGRIVHIHSWTSPTPPPPLPPLIVWTERELIHNNPWHLQPDIHGQGKFPIIQNESMLLWQIYLANEKVGGKNYILRKRHVTVTRLRARLHSSLKLWNSSPPKSDTSYCSQPRRVSSSDTDTLISRPVKEVRSFMMDTRVMKKVGGEPRDKQLKQNMTCS